MPDENKPGVARTPQPQAGQSQDEQARADAKRDQEAGLDDAAVGGPVTGVKPSSLPRKAAAEVEAPAPSAVNPALLADEPEAHIDRVAFVSRDKNGNPDQSEDFEVLVPEEASEQEKAAVLNLPRES